MTNPKYTPNILGGKKILGSGNRLQPLNSVCASGMGLTPIDLFNDILTSENDLKLFLAQNRIENCSINLPGLIIQEMGYFLIRIYY